jgi:hypothetical protein
VGGLARVDPDLLAAVTGAWLADRDRPGQCRRAVAVGAKTLRGSACDGRRVHLLAAMDHAIRAVLAQRQVNGAPGEVPGFQPLLGDLELTGAVVTADALHTHGDAAEFLLTGKQAHYPVKANQPTLLDRCARLAWHNVPVLDRTRDPAHGRVELRALKAVSVRGFGFRTPRRSSRSPAGSATCAVGDGGPWSSTRSPASPRPRPALLGSLISSGGTGRSRTVCTTDVTFAEDASQVRTGTGSQVMACLRNLAIGALSRTGPVNPAAALRHHARDPRRPLAILGITLG